MDLHHSMTRFLTEFLENNEWTLSSAWMASNSFSSSSAVSLFEICFVCMNNLNLHWIFERLADIAGHSHHRFSSAVPCCCFLSVPSYLVACAMILYKKLSSWRGREDAATPLKEEQGKGIGKLCQFFHAWVFRWFICQQLPLMHTNAVILLHHKCHHKLQNQSPQPRFSAGFIPTVPCFQWWANGFLTIWANAGFLRV